MKFKEGLRDGPSTVSKTLVPLPMDFKNPGEGNQSLTHCDWSKNGVKKECGWPKNDLKKVKTRQSIQWTRDILFSEN